MTSGGLWNYYRDEIDDADYNAADDKQFKYKTKIIEKTEERAARPVQPAPNTITIKSTTNAVFIHRSHYCIENNLVSFGGLLIFLW